jgi:hypothetical protein
VNRLISLEKPPVPSTRAEAVVRAVNIATWMLGWAMLAWGR